MKEFLANNSNAFKLRVSINECKFPKGLMHLKFSNEQYDKDGNKSDESSYDFFLTVQQIRELGENLKDVAA